MWLNVIKMQKKYAKHLHSSTKSCIFLKQNILISFFWFCAQTWTLEVLKDLPVENMKDIRESTHAFQI